MPIVKDVHKVPALDLVGWYTILSTSGPQPNHLPIHKQILSYNESAILLGFNPTEVDEASAGGKLPLTIYESNYEADDSTATSGEDKEMKDGDAQVAIKFRELPYNVETGEAEMISVDFVARGGGNATAVDGTSKETPEKTQNTGKGKTRAANKKVDVLDTDTQNYLSRGDEELIASLTAKANAIKMLHSRINLIATYLGNLPEEGNAKSKNKNQTQANHCILRSIQALLSRLSLLIPADSAAFEQELISEQNDVNLVSLLSTLTESIKTVRETGRKFAVVDSARSIKTKQGGGVGGSGWGGGSFGGNMMGVGDLIS